MVRKSRVNRGRILARGAVCMLTLLLVLSGIFGSTEARAEVRLSVTYYQDLGGSRLPCTATVLEPESGQTTFINREWYVVNSDITMNNRLEIYGDVNLILENNCTLRCNAGIYIRENCTLTIWAQSSGGSAGALIADLSERDCRDAGIGSVKGLNGGRLVINGGRITAKGGKAAAGIGGGDQSGFQGITINGGIVEACGYDHEYKKKNEYGGAGIGSGSGYGTGSEPGSVPVTIRGGTVTARGGNGSAGI